MTDHNPNLWRYSWPLDEKGRRYVVLTCPCGAAAAADSREEAEQALSAHAGAVGLTYRAARTTEPHELADVDVPDLVRLVLRLFDHLDGYCPDPHDGESIFYDLPGGAGLVDFAEVLDETDVRTLRECLIGRHEARAAGGVS